MELKLYKLSYHYNPSISDSTVYIVATSYVMAEHLFNHYHYTKSYDLKAIEKISDNVIVQSMPDIKYEMEEEEG